MKKTILFSLTLITITAVWFVLSAAKKDEAYHVSLPLGLDEALYQVPADNPLTAEKVELGKLLYFDPRLSKDGTISCATCHHPQKGFTDQAQFSTGMGSQKGDRNAPTVLNSAFNYFQFWDGRAPSLEEQAKGPIANPIEMGHTLPECVACIEGIPGYRSHFERAFGDGAITIDRIAQSIAAFERTVLSGNSAWDRFTAGDKTALSESAQRGLQLFEGKARCTQCHVGFNLTDGLFHNIGVGMDKATPDLGRFKVTGKEADKGAFKTPMMRDLLKTAPYMHDGSVQTLEEVIELYDRGGEANPWLDPKMQPLQLTAEEKADLLAFLKSLEGDWTPMDEPVLPQ